MVVISFALYNSDHFIGGHDGTQQDIKDTFPNLNWKEDLVANFDTKFIINDMFRFGRVDELDYVRDKLQVTKSLNKKLHPCISDIVQGLQMIM